MSRSRISTTVDSDILDAARRLKVGSTDSQVLEEALRSLLTLYRSREIDASYAAYDEHPIDEPDEWGDLGSWRAAAGST